MRASARPALLLCVIACAGSTRLAGARWEPVTAGTAADLRALTAVSERVAWASGTAGTWLRTIDGGASWQSGVVPGVTQDFRSLVAFSADRALLLTAGSPARLFRTLDGGKSWTEVFHDDRKEIFFDSMAFGDERRGWAVGDPVEGKFAFIATDDGGATWRARPGPPAEKGEAAFAASNSCIRAMGNELWFATGGTISRVFRSRDGGLTWLASQVPAPVGDTSGLFSLAMRDERFGAVVGGDYKRPEAPGFFATTADGGATWQVGPLPPGFRSSVAWYETTIVVTGPTGTDWTPNGATPFHHLGDGFNALAFAGRVGFAVGPAGRVARLTPP